PVGGSAAPLSRRSERDGDPLSLRLHLLRQQGGTAGGQPLRHHRRRPGAARRAGTAGALGGRSGGRLRRGLSVKAVDLLQLARLFVRRQEGGQERILGQGDHLLPVQPERLFHGLEVVGDVAAEVGRVVGVDRDQQSPFQQPPQVVLLQRGEDA